MKNKKTGRLAATLVIAAALAGAQIPLSTEYAFARGPHGGGGGGGGGGVHMGGGGSVNFGGGGGRAFGGGGRAFSGSGVHFGGRSFGGNRSFRSGGAAHFRAAHSGNRHISRGVNRNASIKAARTHERASARANRAHERAAMKANKANERAAARANRTHVKAASNNGRFARHNANARARWAHNHPARWWWRHHRYAWFVPWAGFVFWPYAYADIFDYAFWPYGYYPDAWAYAYDDFFDTVFWGPPVAGYADYASVPRSGRRIARSSRTTTRSQTANAQEFCAQPAAGVTAWPIGQIQAAVKPNEDQKALLDDVKAASEKAAAAFKETCPTDTAALATPPGRLDAMTARLSATLEAVRTVRPALEKFYASLSDEQKTRFDAVGPKIGKGKDNARTAQASANTCGDEKSGLTNVPVERIQQAVKPNEEQQANLQRLQEAANKAVGTMQAACPDETPSSPVGRLDAMEKRLQAMLDAAQTIKPPLNAFYSSLSDDQKARMNAVGRDLASNG